MWDYLTVKLALLKDFLRIHEVIDFLSEPLGIIIIIVVGIAFAYFLLRLSK